MRYFNNPGTLEELDNQFNDLLNQYEYRSGKNISTIEEIRTEYKQIKRQMKQKLEAAVKNVDSVHEPAFERAVENYNIEIETQEPNVGQRIVQQSNSNLQQNDNRRQAAQQNNGEWNAMQQANSAKYAVQQKNNERHAAQQSSSMGRLVHNDHIRQSAQSISKKEEEQDLLVKCKENITGILKDVVRDRKSDIYKMLEDVVFTYDDEAVLHWFNLHTDNMASRVKVCAYNDVRRKLEDELRNASQDQHMEKTYMLRMEKLFGAFIKRKFIEYEILYKDCDQPEQESDQTINKRLKRRGYILGILMGALIFAIGCFFGVVGKVIGLVCAVVAAIVIGRTYYIWRVPEEK